MSETDRTGQIRLAVDQEVFIETVEQDHRVEDANVATEVTSFERVGDAYVLEGAIVFAGYLTKSAGDGAGYGTLGPSARHVHHRMPFTLRVPVQFQPRGVVNVASRISDWRLDVISEGWVRVRAVLQVSGLNGKHGYHFQCGAQEDGDVLFGNSPVDSPAIDETQAELAKGYEPDVSSDAQVSADNVAQSPDMADNHLELVRGQVDEPQDKHKGPIEAETSRLSEARGGANDASDVSVSSSDAGFDEASRDSTNQSRTNESTEVPSAREELLHLDRHVQTGDAKATEALDSSGAKGKRTTVSEEPAEKGASPANASSGTPSGTRVADEETDAASEFEFEHQVDPAKANARQEALAGENDALNQRDSADDGEESFVASRSFSEDGFQATAGFVPTVRVGAQATEEIEPVEDEAPEDGEHRSSVTVDTSLWSFVDFNAPENFYTMRYVIVMDEESISSVAERVGCSETELVRANQVSSEAVLPGQVLKVPRSIVRATE